MISILQLCFQIHHSLDEFNNVYLDSVKHQAKYFNVLATASFNSDVVLPCDDNYSNIIFYKCKYKGSNTITKILNLIGVYRHNVKCVRKYKSDLIQVSLRASNIRYIFIFIFPLLFRKKKFYLRLSTPAVNKSRIVRFLHDFIVSVNIIAYKYVGSSTDNNKKKLWIPNKKYIPVIGRGRDFGYKDRSFKNFHLVYIGKISLSREIWKSVRGLALFIKNNPNISVTYDIIGKGPNKDTLELINEINRNDLEDVVTYHGFLENEKVIEIFKRCDFGVAYVPVNDYFQNDSGKTLEYALSGMAIIATANRFRGKWVNENVGVLCEDNPESFAISLKKLYDNRDKYNSRIIKEHFHEFSEEHVMLKSTIPTLKKIINS